MSMHPKELKVGDLFWESSQYGNAQMRVMSEPTQTSDDLWEWEAENVDTGTPQHYAWNSRFCKPGIYDEPAYVGVPMV